MLETTTASVSDRWPSLPPEPKVLDRAEEVLERDTRNDARVGEQREPVASIEALSATTPR